LSAFPDGSDSSPNEEYEHEYPALTASAINLDQPGTYLHWSIFYVSVANLVLIAVMVVIFGVALLLPFPKGKTYPAAADLPAGTDPGTLAGPPSGAPSSAPCCSPRRPQLTRTRGKTRQPN
jgi:hypothetical protein